MYESSNNLSAVDDLIARSKGVLEYYTVRDPERWSTLHRLGMALRQRFERTGSFADLEEAIRYHEEELSICPPGHSGRAFALNNLGFALYVRFLQTGNSADLSDSIRYCEEKLSICPPGHSGRSSALNNLSNALYKRFQQTGTSADLKDSIRYYGENLASCAPGHSGRRSALNNLGLALYARLGRPVIPPTSTTTYGTPKKPSPSVPRATPIVGLLSTT